MAKVWTKKKANDWYRDLPWLVGCNYSPRNAINQLEMWQADTFSPALIDEELKWASSIGMNSIRVFLHDLLWKQDARKFLARIDKFLGIAHKHGIGTMIVFFDSVWHPFPYAGKQRDPEPGVHNSGWAQSPGVDVLQDYARFEQLHEYVTGVIRHFADDPRVVVWDLWNEPDNPNAMSYGVRDLGPGKAKIVSQLIPKVFAWARAGKPSQPLTSGIWLGDWASEATMKEHERVQIGQSDVISFHDYGRPDHIERKVIDLQRYKRPMICTEYMSRGTGSTFEGVLPVLKKHKVGAFCWGLVAGKTQTKYPWDSWQRPYRTEPSPWFHEVFHPDGRPYRSEEVDVIASLTNRGRIAKPKRGQRK